MASIYAMIRCDNQSFGDFQVADINLGKEVVVTSTKGVGCNAVLEVSSIQSGCGPWL